jgi:hypothetical protein
VVVAVVAAAAVAVANNAAVAKPLHVSNMDLTERQGNLVAVDQNLDNSVVVEQSSTNIRMRTNTQYNYVVGFSGKFLSNDK